MQLHFRAGYLATDHATPTLAARTDKRIHASAVRPAAITSGMPVPWRSSADAFAEILQRRGVEPEAVVDVEAAWEAFEEFVQVSLTGIEGPENDGDCIIAQWGKWDWNEEQPTLSFGRQLAVSEGDRRDRTGNRPIGWSSWSCALLTIRPGPTSTVSACRTPDSTLPRSALPGPPCLRTSIV